MARQWAAQAVWLMFQALSRSQVARFCRLCESGVSSPSSVARPACWSCCSSGSTSGVTDWDCSCGSTWGSRATGWAWAKQTKIAKALRNKMNFMLLLRIKSWGDWAAWKLNRLKRLMQLLVPTPSFYRPARYSNPSVSALTSISKGTFCVGEFRNWIIWSSVLFLPLRVLYVPIFIVLYDWLCLWTQRILINMLCLLDCRFWPQNNIFFLLKHFEFWLSSTQFCLCPTNNLCRFLEIRGDAFASAQKQFVCAMQTQIQIRIQIQIQIQIQLENKRQIHIGDYNK